MPKELTVAEIQRIVRRFVEASLRTREAGYDAIELHGAHGYLIGQFLSPNVNLRQDEYGGDLKRRTRFYVELIQGIKKALGDDYPVICRMNGHDYSPGGLEIDEAVEIAAILEQAGADSISMSGGIHSSRPYRIVPGMGVERGCYVAYAEAVKKRVRVPVMTVGRINTPELAEEILEKDQADFICLSRPLIADPYFGVKAKADKPEEIVPCIACNECLATIHHHKGIACTVNPIVSRELELKPLLARVPERKRVAIVGAGAAGMSAAVTAAKRGHEVHLFERDSVLGGQLNIAHTPPHREEIENALIYFTREVKRLNIDVRLNSSLSVEEARKLQPDAIIVATGAESQMPAIPGANLPHVTQGWRVLAGRQVPGNNCVVIGGGLVGVEVADYLAERGKKVALVVRSEMLKKAVHADRVYFLDRIASLDIEVFLRTDVIDIGADWVTIQPANRLRRRLTGVDHVVLCTGYSPRKAESEQLGSLGRPVHYVGDVVGSRKFFEAIEEGTLTALKQL
jgi:NADPH-dependent 2,4-dienoyl-CoA reductase/sulfur reductase-like enzyme